MPLFCLEEVRETEFQRLNNHLHVRDVIKKDDQPFHPHVTIGWIWPVQVMGKTIDIMMGRITMTIHGTGILSIQEVGFQENHP